MCDQKEAKEMLDFIINNSPIKEFSIPIDEKELHYDIKHNCYIKKISKEK